MVEERLPLRILECCPLVRRRKGRPLNSWMQEVDNKNEREGNWRLGMGRQRRVEKGNKFILGTERCENLKNLYIND